jgi:chromosome segregation ATPase
MTTSALTLDHEPFTDCFRQWRADEQEFAAELEDSLAALDAYQAHLDHWARELAAERNTFQRDCSEWEHRKQAREQQLEALSAELADAREQIVKLTNDLTSKINELRGVEKMRADLAQEVDRLRSEIQHTVVDQQSLPVDRPPQQPQPVADNPVTKNTAPSPIRLSNNPVIGSVVAQFDKLRQQQAEGRKRRLQRH